MAQMKVLTLDGLMVYTDKIDVELEKKIEGVKVNGSELGIDSARKVNIDLSAYAVNSYVDTELGKKVDKVAGKGLSTNDYTTTEKTKVSGIATGAQVNVIETVKVNGTALTPSSKAVNIDLSNYATKADVSAIPKFATLVVEALPSSGISDSTIYLVPNGASETNSHDEYIRVDGAWELIGTTEIDISGKADKTYVNTELEKKANVATTYSKTQVDGLVSPKADKTYVDTELEKKANATHSHAIANVSGLQIALDAKANSADFIAITAAEIDVLFT